MGNSEKRLSLSTLRQIARRVKAVDLDALPFATYDQRGSLPRVSGVYLMFRAGKLVYIGETSSIFMRCGYFSHEVYRGTADRSSLSIAYLPERCPYKRRALEQMLVATHSPERNRTPVSPYRQGILNGAMETKPGPKPKGGKK